MKTQTIINIVFAVAFVGYVVSQRNPTFDTITCKRWDVVDAEGNIRIGALTSADGIAVVSWRDKDGKGRISAYTTADGDGTVLWIDKDGEVRIAASTFADGTVDLPTKDRTTPIEP